MKRIRNRILDIIPYVIVTLVIGILIYCKRDYYLDELLSYSLSNNEVGWMQFTDGQWYDPVSLYDSQLSAQADRTFDYATVWENQKGDVHPPLYYSILHTVCSFMPGVVNRWQPALINWLFAMLTMFVIRKLVHRLFDIGNDSVWADIIIPLTSLVGIVLPGVLNNISFYRMYVMAMFWVIWALYMCICMLDTCYAGERMSWTQWLLLLVVNICSALTHYYCIMYLVFLELTFVLILARRKAIGEILRCIGVAVVSAILAIAIFPAMLTHIFGGYRGQESFSNASTITPAQYWSQCLQLFHGISRELFGGTLAVLLIIAVLMHIYKVRCVRPTWGIQCAVKLMLIVPGVCYYLLLSAIAVQVTTRYLFPIYAVAYVGVIYLIWDALDQIPSYRYWLMLVLFASITIGSYRMADWRYLYRSDSLRDSLQDAYKGMDAVVVYDVNWKCVELYRQLQNCADVIYLRDDELSMLDDAIDSRDGLLLFATNEEYVDAFMEYIGNDMSCVDIGEHTDFTVYYVSQNE